MKSKSFIFILFILANIPVNSISIQDQCSGRWKFIDKLNIKITLDWQILSKTNILVTEFRTNRIEKGFWYAFGISSSPEKSTNGLVYTLRWRENDTESFWDIYNITESNVIISKEHHSSDVTFQRLITSGLLTVQPAINLTSFLRNNQCLYFVYMRGRLSDDQPLIPDEIRFNHSLCLTCQESEFLSTIPLMFNNSSTEKIRLLEGEDLTTMTSIQSSSSSYRKEMKFFWFGRIVNRLWSNDYKNLNSFLSQKLRIDLQNLFLLLINSNSSYSFICNQFQFYSLQSGSILFASNITLISNLSEDQTLNIMKNLLNTVNDSQDNQLKFDGFAHHINRANESSQIDNLFERFSRTTDSDFEEQNEFDSTLHLLIGCFVGIGFLMILITSILCLYGYYKCRRRRFRRFTERQTFKFKQDINSYTWLGQQPSITSSSSPYLIQSTSI